MDAYYKVTVFRIVWIWYSSNWPDEWNRLKYPEIDLKMNRK